MHAVIVRWLAFEFLSAGDAPLFVVLMRHHHPDVSLFAAISREVGESIHCAHGRRGTPCAPPALTRSTEGTSVDR